MRRLFTLLFLSAFYCLAHGQQIISSTGGIFQNNRVNCQVTVGEVTTGSQAASVPSSIQIVPGIFFLVDGIILPAGIDPLVLPDMNIRFSSLERIWHICQPGENVTECKIYTLKGDLLYHSAFVIKDDYSLSLKTLGAGIYITYFLFLFLPFILMAYGQVPKAFNYQAVVRNAAGEVLAEQPLSVTIQILEDTV